MRALDDREKLERDVSHQSRHTKIRETKKVYCCILRAVRSSFDGRYSIVIREGGSLSSSSRRFLSAFTAYVYSERVFFPLALVLEDIY